MNRVDDQAACPNGADRKYVSFIGRIDRYKGMDTFLDEGCRFDGKSDRTFYLGGKGDLSPYRDKMRGISNRRVENRFLTNEEVDDRCQASIFRRFVTPNSDLGLYPECEESRAACRGMGDHISSVLVCTYYRECLGYFQSVDERQVAVGSGTSMSLGRFGARLCYGTSSSATLQLLERFRPKASTQQSIASTAVCSAG